MGCENVVDFTRELKAVKVLLNDDIIRLRQYIQTKYPHYDHSQRASILASTIWGIVDKHLMSFPVAYRKEISERLLKNSLVGNQDGVFLFDIFEASLSIGVDEEDFLESLCTWVNTHVVNPIDKNELLQFHMQALPMEEEFELAVVTPDIPLEVPTIHKVEDTVINRIECKRFYFEKAFLKKAKFAIIMLLALFLFAVNLFYQQLSAQNLQDLTSNIESDILYQHPHLPQDFYYREVDEIKLRNYLQLRNSILEQEPYFSSIIETAKEFELNPHLFFAIAGHEQGFVPKDHPSAEQIANNPYNVFNSWQKYNTDIVDSTSIAARTIINLAKDQPTDMDPFQWINRRYAEDENWWKGVRSIFNRLEKEQE